MEWVDRPQNYKGFVWDFATFAGLPFGQFSMVTFQLKSLDFQSKQV